MEFWLAVVAWASLFMAWLLLFIILGVISRRLEKRLEHIENQLGEFAVQLSFIAGRIGLQRSDFRVPPVVGPSEELKTDVVGGDQWDTTEEDAERLAEEAESGRYTRPENE